MDQASEKARMHDRHCGQAIRVGLQFGKRNLQLGPRRKDNCSFDHVFEFPDVYQASDIEPEQRSSWLGCFR